MIEISNTRRIRKDSSIPYYEQLKRVLLDQIEGGTFKPGDLMPPEWEIVNLYGVSRTVVRQAIGDLVTEGRVYRLRGKGTFVSEKHFREQFIESTVGYFEDLPSGDEDIHRKVLSIEITEQPPHVVKALNLAVGEKVVMVSRQRFVGGEIGSYTQHYFPMTLHPNLLATLKMYDLHTKSIYSYLDEVCGIQIRSGHRTVEAIAASLRLAKFLEVSKGAPTLYIQGIGRDSSEKLVEFFEAWHRGDRTQIDIEVAGPTRSAGIVNI